MPTACYALMAVLAALTTTEAPGGPILQRPWIRSRRRVDGQGEHADDGTALALFKTSQAVQDLRSNIFTFNMYFIVYSCSYRVIVRV